MSSNLDFGVIGNCKTAALVSKEGSIDWLCFPDFDRPAIFSRLLDQDRGGRFGFIVSEEHVCSQAYLPDTNILCTCFAMANSAFEVLDFMPRYRTSGEEYYMPPEIYRLIRPIRGVPNFRIAYEPVMNYAREEPVHYNRKNFVRTAASGNIDDNIYLYSSLALDVILEQRDITLTRDEFLLLSYHQKLIDIDLARVNLELERTKVYWMNWSNRSVKFEKYENMVSRSLLVLKLMTYDRTGAILAALTTSLPEAIGEERNWDYRYCWLRDASMSITTLLRMGHPNAAQRFLHFVKGIIRSKYDTFQIMYGIRGERMLTEETLDHLAGYANSRPVRIGNAAYTQRQNDVYGYLLDVIHSYYLFFPGTLDEIEEMWELVKKMGRIVTADWQQADQSIWEFRGKQEHFVFSKVMCWVALDRAAKIASLLGHSDYEARDRAQADAIRKEVFTKGWNPRIRSFSQYYGSESVDASLLLMAQYGFIDPGDERYVKTVDRIRQELFHNGLVYRYKDADDFGMPTSAFTICTFWLIRALYVTGRQEEAVAMFDELITYCNHVELFSEDLDFDTKRQLGNFPQAYSHLALIDVVELISEKRFWSTFIRA
ncbi:MAG: glycoside hydrolase family 15 protein [Desulfovibrionaceae bacterium]|nr:glycoside hydrolase family 15 protein [Desulfovibrionaceae bacterium]